MDLDAPEFLRAKLDDLKSHGYADRTRAKLITLVVLRHARAGRYLEAELAVDSGLEEGYPPQPLLVPVSPSEEKGMTEQRREVTPGSIAAGCAVLGLVGALFVWVNAQTTQIALNGQAIVQAQKDLNQTIEKLDGTLGKLDGTLDRIDRNQLRLANALGVSIENPRE